MVPALFASKQEIMWKHFVELGPLCKGGTLEEDMADKIFQKLKSGLGKGGRFFKQLATGVLFEVTDDAAHMSEHHTQS